METNLWGHALGSLFPIPFMRSPPEEAVLVVTLPDHTGLDSGHPVFVVHNGMVAGTLFWGDRGLLTPAGQGTPIKVETPG